MKEQTSDDFYVFFTYKLCQGGERTTYGEPYKNKTKEQLVRELMGDFSEEQISVISVDPLSKLVYEELEDMSALRDENIHLRGEVRILEQLLLEERQFTGIWGEK